MSDDLDIDWGKDPFEGDIDFDFDFDSDPFAKKGLMSGMVGGFLSGITDAATSPESITRGIRSVLPDSFSNAFYKADRVKWRIEDLAREFREENYDTVKSLQNIAAKVAEKAEGKLSDSKVDKLKELSEKDFSDWEKWTPGGESKPEFNEASAEDSDYMLRQLMDSQSESMGIFASTINSMSAAVGGGIQSSIAVSNRQLVNIESGVRDLMDYQRTVQAKIEQSKLSLLARTYVTNAKYYKFMERAMHSEIAELKKITKASYMSDFQKTSMFTSGREYMRNKIFTTVAERSGGIFGKMNEMFGKDKRDETYGTIANLFGSISDAVDMADGIPWSRGMIGDLLGKHLANSTIEGIPTFFKYGPGKKVVDKLRKKFPKQSAEIDKMVKDLTELGDVASYATNAAPGVINHLSQNFVPVDEQPFYDYNEYVESLPNDQKPLPKAVWEVTNFISNKSKTAFNDFMLDIGKSQGTEYTLKRNRPEDLLKPSTWTGLNDKSLNEIIPGLLTEIHTSIEKIRTGDSNAKGVTFNHMRNRFMTQDDDKKALTADLMSSNEMSRYASAALEIVDTVDSEKLLSPGARKELAMAVAKDVDKGNGFNPFFYIGNVDGISKNYQKEITAVMMRYFGIDNDHVARYENGSGLDKLKAMTVMGTAEGKERLNQIGSNVDYMQDYFPNISSKIDLLRATGNEQVLRDMGLIYNEYGTDKLNMNAFYDRLGKFIEDPRNPELRGLDLNNNPGTPTVPNAINTGNGGPGIPATIQVDNSELTEQFGGLSNKITEMLGKLTESSINKPNQGLDQLFDPKNGFMDSLTGIKDSTAGSYAELQSLNNQFAGLHELIQSSKFIVKVTDVTESSVDNETEDEETRKKKELKKAKTTIWNHLKSLMPKNLLNNGLDLLAKNQPLILGGLLGGIGSHFIQNPWVAGGVALAGIGLGALAQREVYVAQTGGEPNDNEDILDANGNVILEAKRLNAGYYVDTISKKVLKTWKDIKGPVTDFMAKRVIDITTLSGKIFGPDGRELALKGLNKAKQAAQQAWNFLDPIGQARKIMKFGKDLVFQQDVYVPGEKEPRLLGKQFKNNSYFKVDENNSTTVITGWNEIDGAVYDSNGSILITQSEYEAGLVTTGGVKIRKIGSLLNTGKNFLSKFVKDKTDQTLNKFGYNKTDTEVNSFGNLTGVEERLDSIYKLLCKKFGVNPENKPEDYYDPNSPVWREGESDDHKEFGDGPRQNSLEYKKQEEEAARKEKVDEAIIKLGENSGKSEEGNEEKPTTVLGMLKNFALTAFPLFTKFLKNPFWMLSSTLRLPGTIKTLGTIGSALLSPLLGMASPLFKMLKSGLLGLGKALLGRNSSGTAGDLTGGGTGGGRRTKGKGKWKGRAGKAGLIAGGLMLANQAFSSEKSATDDIDFNDVFNPVTNEDGERTKEQDLNKFEQVVETVSDWIPQTAIMKYGLEAVLGEEKTNWLKNTGLFWTSDGTFFTSREKAAQHEASLGKTSNKQVTTQKRIRFAQYGIKDIDSPLAKRVMMLEDMMIDHVYIKSNRAMLMKDTPMDAIFDKFVKAGNYRDTDSEKTWFLARFKPVFMVYASAVYIAKYGDIFEYDNSREYDAVLVAERVQQALATLDPYPFGIDVRIDNTEGLMGDVKTREYVTLLIAKLKKEIAKPDAGSSDVIKTAEEAQAAPTGYGGYNGVPFGGDGGKSKEDLMANAIKATEEQNLVSQIKTAAEAKLIDISDMHKDSKTEIDAFVMARLAIYGNTDNNPARVDAVLRLERYMEDLIVVLGKDARFIGKTADVLKLFKPMFKLNSDVEITNWMIWFRDRFLPTAMEYVKQVHIYRNGKPAKAWKQLTATNKAEIARLLYQQIVFVDGKEKSIWEISSSPFPGTKSGTQTSAIDKFLKILDAKATQAVLKEPELEERASQTYSDRAAKKPLSSDAINARTQSAMDEVYKTGSISTGGSYGTNGGGTGTTTGAMGKYQSEYNGKTFNYSDLSGGGSAGNISGEVNGEFNPEFIKIAGEDKGIKMSPEQGEQLLLRHLVKAGITDIKTIALALAMAKKESGNYSTTVENTNWKAPALRKYFKNIPDEATAQKVAAMSPPERAMWVYGRAPKGPQLGNTKPEDGWLYRGRGLFQVTGKANYERYKKETGVDVVKDPKLMSEDPNVIADSAVRFLKNSKAMMAISKTGDFESAMRGINGGNAVPGSDERRKYYVEYLNRLKAGDLRIEGTSDTKEDSGDPTDPTGATQTASATPPSKPDNPDPGFVDTTAGVVGSKPVPGAGNAEDVKPVKPGDTKKMLEDGINGSTTNTASTVPQNPSPTGSGTPTSPTTPVPAAVEASKPETQVAKAAPKAPVSDTPAPAAKPVEPAKPVREPRPEPAKEQSVAQATVNMPNVMQTSDPVAHDLLKKLITKIDRSGSGVSVS